MAEIRWTAEAVRWLEDIHTYIAQDSPSAAQRVVTSIYEKAQILAEFPEIGYVHGRSGEGVIRILLYGHYRVAYYFNQNSVIILGIFHGSLDITRYNL